MKRFGDCRSVLCDTVPFLGSFLLIRKKCLTNSLILSRMKTEVDSRIRKDQEGMAESENFE